MKVEELIIDGFKSYAARTVISNWDPQFNAITGLNGSGKSNILDSICFVLGISSMSTVRAQSLQDLIYKRGQAGVTKASVTIVFDNSDKKNSPIGFETYPKISITRQIILGGTSKYLINGHRAQQQTVLHLFQSVQLNINNPNFLIMQGKITKVLNMKPTEILALIEEASGTRMFEDRREKAEKTMAKKETKLQEIRSLLEEEIEPKLEKLRSEKREFIEFQETQAALEKIQRIIHVFDYHHMSTKCNLIKENLEKNELEIEKLKNYEEKCKCEVTKLYEDLKLWKFQKQEELEKDGRLSELEKQESNILSEISRLNMALTINSEDINLECDKLNKLQKNVSSFTQDLVLKTKSCSENEQTYNMLNKEIETLKELHKNKEELLSTLTTGVSSTGTIDNGYSSHLSSTRSKLNDAKIATRRANMKLEMLRKELASNEPKMQQAKSNNAHNIEQIEEYHRECEELKSQLNDLGFNPNIRKDLMNKESQLKEVMYEFSNDIEYLKKKVANIEFDYSKPSCDFNPNSVKGSVARLFTLDEANFVSATALQVCAGGRLFNIVVDNETTASQLLENGKLRKRVTIIPLNKISVLSLRQNSLDIAKKIAPGKVELALNLITYETAVSKAMEFIFGNSLICNDSDTAKKVTFHSQIKTRSITLEGDVYDPEGTLSGGSRNSTSTLLVDIQKYNQSFKKYHELEIQLKEIQKKLGDYEQISENTKLLQNQLNLAVHKLHLAKKKLNTDLGSQIIKRNQEIRRDILDCEIDMSQQKLLSDELEKEVLSIEKDIEEFRNDKGTKIQELQHYVAELSSQLKKSENEIEKRYDALQALQLEKEQLESDISSGKETIQELENSIQSLRDSIVVNNRKLQENKELLLQIQRGLSDERSKLVRIEDKIIELETLLKSKREQISSTALKIECLNNEMDKSKNSVASINQMIQNLFEENDWLQDQGLVNGIILQNKGINLEEYRQSAMQLQETFQTLKRKVNLNIISMIENVEKKESSLKSMIKTIEKDKMKIKETVQKLNEYKKDTLIKTWEKVSIDFGDIFSDLLPNSFAKLVVSEGKDITQGLEVKVRLGSIWKDSLIELSGGQRSLIALSLILALLQFKPAPMYILDEVDAALDLSHTQNIGHLIKTRFKGSQFIIVSLKEGMFTNANRIFKTRFQDGTSMVGLV